MTTGEVQIKHLDGIEMVLILYPYTVAGGFVVNDKGSDGVYNAHFGLILQQEPPVCHHGYESTNERNPENQRGNAPMNENARCTEPPTVSNPRGAQNASGRVAPRTGPEVATYDQSTGKVTYAGTSAGTTEVTYTVAPCRVREGVVEVVAAPAAHARSDPADPPVDPPGARPVARGAAHRGAV